MHCIVALLIDMQDNFIDREEIMDLIPNQISVLNFCCKNNIPIIVIEKSEGGNTNRPLLDAINNNNYYKIEKPCNDGFIKTTLQELLEKNNAKTLLIMGINACACIWETTITAKKKGYEIVTSEDLITGYCKNCTQEHKEEWYKANTIYTVDHRHILQNLR